MKPILLGLIISACVATFACAAKVPNQVANPDFERAGKGDLPADWERRIIGVEPKFRVTTDAHGGKSAACIDADEITRAYVSSAPIPVAPGEKLAASAWVNVKDVQKGMGTVIAIAHFARADGSNDSVAKINTADVTKPGWQQIKGTIEVPADVEHLRIRLGFSYSKGTCCWDDVDVRPVEPVVGRISIPGGRLSPGIEALPVTILNRTGAKEALKVQLTLGEKPFAVDVELDGKPTQTVKVPISIDKRGRSKLALSLLRVKEEKPFLTQSIDVPVPPALVLDPPIPTHWVVEDGPPQVEGDVLLALKSATRKGANLVINVLDESNKVVATWNTYEHRDGINSYTIKPGKLPLGKYKVEALVEPKSGEPIRATQNWSIITRSKAKVTINERGFPVYDGKAIFPLGIFNSGKPEEPADAGFTVTHAYNATRVAAGVRPDDARMLDFLDNTEKVGMKALTMVPLEFATHGDWEPFRRRIRMFRNHPAILAWDEEEGLARGEWTLDTLAKVREIVREEDPHHPMMVGDARDVIFRIKDRSNFFPHAYMDFGMWWWYPIPMKKESRLDDLEGVEVAGLELTPPTFLTRANTNKPIWVGIQSYKKENGRFPTPVEYRAQAYIALAENARGLMWYGGFVTGGMFLAQNKSEAHWPELKKLVTELNSLQDVLLGTTEQKPSLSPTNVPVSVALKRGPKRLVLIAANRSDKPLDLTIESASIPAGSVQVIGEDRKVRSAGGSIKDHFDAYAVHVYQLP